MGKPTRVITWSSDNFAYGNDRDSVLKQLRDQLASSASYHPDLVCFTEESMLPCEPGLQCGLLPGRAV